jgi:hypothetical protein
MSEWEEEVLEEDNVRIKMFKIQNLAYILTCLKNTILM